MKVAVLELDKNVVPCICHLKDTAFQCSIHVLQTHYHYYHVSYR